MIDNNDDQQEGMTYTAPNPNSVEDKVEDREEADVLPTGEPPLVKDVEATKYYVMTSENNSIEGYYASDVHDDIPVGAVEITESQWQESLQMGANTFDGKEFAFVEEVITYTDEETKLRIAAKRKYDYSKESDHLFLEWQYDKSAESEAVWRNKVLEIKEKNPFK